MRISRIIILVVIIVAVGLGVWYFKFYEKPTVVEQVFTENVIITKSISGSGAMESDNDASLAFASSGIIKSINAKKDDEVSQGKILAGLNVYSDSQTAQSYRDARDIALRERDLFIEQYANDKDAIGGEAQFDIRLRQLNEQISQAEARYNAQLGSLANSYIKAPFVGTIIEVYKKVGEVAAPGETIFRLVDTNDIHFIIEIDQEDFSFIKERQIVKITFDAYPEEEFLGKVDTLPSYLETEGSSEILKVEILVDPKDDRQIILGMTGDVEILVDETPTEVQALVFDEVISANGQNFVWIINDQGRLEKLPVEIGLEGDIFTEIITDLTGKTIVIPSENGQVLLEGQKTTIAKSEE